MHPMCRRRLCSLFDTSAFTLIELLVVIAIIAILAVVVVLTLNPAQLLAQSRDANRVSDMATLNSAINLYTTDQSGASSFTLGSSTNVYLSIPSASSSCASLGLPALPSSTYSYACASSTSSRNTNSQGWIPLNFNNISAGSPFGSLPVDPINQTSSNLYYTYQTGNGQYVLTTFMESQKYAKTMATTGGVDPALYEVGTGANTLPDLGRGLVGYWPMDEGSGNLAIDQSGGGNNGQWSGAQVGTNNTYYSPGKVGPWGGAFDGSSTIVTVGTPTICPTSSITISAWIYQTTITSLYPSIGGESSAFLYENPNGGQPSAVLNINSTPNYVALRSATLLNVWQFLAVTYNGNTISGYDNGVLNATTNATGTITPPCSKYYIGGGLSSGSFPGFIDDLRIYDRALSATEIQQLYNAEK